MRRSHSTLKMTVRGIGNYQHSQLHDVTQPRCSTIPSIAPPRCSAVSMVTLCWRLALDANASAVVPAALLRSTLHAPHPPLRLKGQFFLLKSESLIASAELLRVCAALLRQERNYFPQSGGKPFILNPDSFKLIEKIVCPPWETVVLLLCFCDPCCWNAEQHVCIVHVNITWGICQRVLALPLLCFFYGLISYIEIRNKYFDVSIYTHMCTCTTYMYL